MKALFALAVACLFVLPAFAAHRDPAPVVADADEARPDDGRQLVGLFDFVRPTRTVCENGVCRTVPAVASPPAPVATATAGCACGESCPCGATPAALSARPRPFLSLFERVRDWYPGKAFAAFRANLAARRGR